MALLFCLIAFAASTTTAVCQTDQSVDVAFDVQTDAVVQPVSVFVLSVQEANMYNELLHTGLYFKELRQIVDTRNKEALKRLWTEHQTTPQSERLYRDTGHNSTLGLGNQAVYLTNDPGTNENSSPLAGLLCRHTGHEC